MYRKCHKKLNRDITTEYKLYVNRDKCHRMSLIRRKYRSMAHPSSKNMYHFNKKRKVYIEK